mgnify:CR=1 FL=1
MRPVSRYVNKLANEGLEEDAELSSGLNSELNCTGTLLPVKKRGESSRLKFSCSLFNLSRFKLFYSSLFLIWDIMPYTDHHNFSRFYPVSFCQFSRFIPVDRRIFSYIINKLWII